MAVLLPNCALTVSARIHPLARDARMMPVPAATAPPAAVSGPWPGNAERQPDASYLLRMDIRHWPVRQGDRVDDDQGRVFILTGLPAKYQVPGAPDVDHIAVTATLEPPEVQ